MIVIPQTLGMILSGCILICRCHSHFSCFNLWISLPNHIVLGPKLCSSLFLKTSSIPSLSCWYCNWGFPYMGVLKIVGLQWKIPWKSHEKSHYPCFGKPPILTFLLMVFDGPGPIFWWSNPCLVRQALLCPKPGCLLLKKPGRPGTWCFFGAPGWVVLNMFFFNKNLGWIYKNWRLTQQH